MPDFVANNTWRIIYKKNTFTLLGKRASNIINESVKVLKALLNKTSNPIVRLRLETALVLKSHPLLTRNQIACMMGISKRSIERWLHNYKQGGLASFISIKPQPPKKSVINKEIHDALEVKLHNKANTLRGYKDAQNWINEEFDTFIKYQTIRSYMIRHFGKHLRSSCPTLFIKDKHFRDVGMNKGLRDIQESIELTPRCE